MGMEYARAEGMPKEVYTAIYEHYLPSRSGGPVPESEIGAIVGCADRMDTIVGCFAVGLEPTGSADPFALRRHSLAILRILEKMGWDVSLNGFIGEAIANLSDKLQFNKSDVSNKVLDFFKERYKHRMLGKGNDPDLIESVISVSFEKINRVNLVVEQLKNFASESDEFPALIQTFKRVSNIIKKQHEFYEVNGDLLKENCEFSLWELYKALSDEISQCFKVGDFSKALQLLAKLRKPVDDFFEGVEILTDESELVRKNRVGILQNIERLFLSVADLSKFST
jgi:glycyl-tRNA synthetase beta chain